MPALFILIAIAAPSSADIQALEVTRVTGPYVDAARDRRPYAEFAPSVETRDVHCEATAAANFDCRYDVRTKEFFDNAFGSWEPVTVRLQWKDGRWRIVDPDK